ncbi:MFS general substrate transporter [Hypoxylon trugodes]|uniref:MFS general substrate transporter n=1 Tax=Hypoxylon trugodes TaxID=326681 RepID=UPI0021A1FE43|nr:MFS general substrate transporter [Hypoxylon trugodes]KAI1384359.1 MFS general substrate transporter [Hypoxylon trugodes]
MEGASKEWPATFGPNDERPTYSSEETVGHVNGGHTAVGPTVDQTIAAKVAEKEKVKAETGKREIKEEDCESELGFAFPTWKKWWILTVIFLVQTSMNFNTSLYSNGLEGISGHFGVSEQAARVGAAIFLITYAFGCELWAPWSEEIGRKPILQASLFLTNLFTLPVVLAPNFGCLLAGRALGGLSTAGGSVTLGMIADMFESDRQQYAVAYIVFSSVGGSILGPIVGGFVQILPPEQAWKWCIWIQLIFGGAVQILHFFTVPETRTTIMLNKIAKKRRKSGEDPNIYGPDEIESFWNRFTFRELIFTWLRPFRMFVTEPIVLTLSLLSGFSDALIFMQIQSFALVYGKGGWNFNNWQVGLAFLPIGLGYVIGWLLFLPAFKRNQRRREKHPEDEHAQYESRMSLLLWLAPCLPIGLIIFAWTSSGPPLHWIGSMFGTCIIGIANYAIYMATIDYMVCAYGPYSASATGGNGWARDFLAGVLTLPATPFYTNIGREKDMNLQYASTILFCISVVLVIAVYVIYWKGPVLRKRSPFAQSLAQGTAEVGGHHLSQIHSHRPSTAGGNTRPQTATTVSRPPTAPTREVMQKRPGDRMSASRHNSYYSAQQAASRRQSRQASRNPSRRGSLEHHRKSVESEEGVSHHHLHHRLQNLNTIASNQQP